MNNPEKYFVEKPVNSEADRKKRIEILFKEEAEKEKHPKKEVEKDNLPTIEETLTTENKHHYNFRVPANIYTDSNYRDKLNNAKTVAEVENIITDYRKHNPIRVREKNKKKHWWQGRN